MSARLGRVIRTWTFWYFLLPALLLPLLRSNGHPQSELEDLLGMFLVSLVLPAAPLLYLLNQLVETLEPLWLVEIVLVAWAFLAGFVADFVTRRVRRHRGLASH